MARLFICSFGAFALLMSPNVDAYQGGPVTNGGTIAGQVTYTGTAPKAEQLKVTQDQHVCGKKPITSEALLVGAGGALRNAVVWIEGIKAGKPATKSKVTIDNTGCRFVPHVQGAVAGSGVDVKNSDDVLHNTHARMQPRKTTVFNVGLPILNQISKQRLARPGVIKVGCDAGHTWMSAWVHVFDHPYFAVTGPDGKFELGDVPAGDYTLTIWHEKLGKKTATAKVTAAGKVTVSVSFAP